MWDLLRKAQGVARLERRVEELSRQLLTQGARLDAGDEASRALTAESSAAIIAQLGEISSGMAAVRELHSAEVRSVLRAIVCEDAENRRRLWRTRDDPEYGRPFSEPEPLVSVVIPTRDRAELLATRALPSVLNQGYEKLEVLVIGDHADREIEQAVASLRDPRVSFHNLSQRLPLAADPLKSWYVQSVMARNEGFRLARGQWLVSFDDDDELYPESVGRLLDTARRLRVEVAYGRFRWILTDGTTQEAGEFPPRLGQFNWSTAIWHRGLRFFERELFAADFDTPNDAFLVEAMLRAGVRFAMVPDVIFDYYPARRV